MSDETALRTPGLRYHIPTASRVASRANGQDLQDLQDSHDQIKNERFNPVNPVHSGFSR
jgi:hypothetical protein